MSEDNHLPKISDKDMKILCQYHSIVASTTDGKVTPIPKALTTKLVTRFGSGVEEDSELKAALTSLFEAIQVRDGYPLVWKIGGGALLLQEFVMPIMSELVDAVETTKNNGKKVIFEMKNTSSEERSENNTRTLYTRLNDGEFHVVIANTKRLDLDNANRPYREYDLSRKTTAPPAGPQERALPSRYESPKFDYGIYMQSSLIDKMIKSKALDWWTSMPAIIADHSPSGQDSLIKTAGGLFKEIHKCAGLHASLAAIRSPNSRCAAILPSYMTLGVPGISRLPLKSPALDDLTGHSISVLWKNTFIDKSKGNENKRKGPLEMRATRVIEAITSSVDRVIRSAM
jgi:hypothetical protein